MIHFYYDAVPSKRFRYLNHTEIIAISETSVRQLTYFSSCPQIQEGLFCQRTISAFEPSYYFKILCCLTRQVRFYHLNNPVNSEDGGKARIPDLG